MVSVLKAEQYEGDGYCPNCGKDTNQLYVSGGHERDSSNDYQRCLECRWWRIGFRREWNPPLEATPP